MSSMGDSKRILEILTAHFGEAGERLHTGVEVGVHKGSLSERLLRQFPGLFLWMVDSWSCHDPSSDYAKSGDSCAHLSFDEQSTCMKAAKIVTDFAGSRRTILRLPSVEAAKRVPCPRLSFVFLDGDHTEGGVHSDIEAWWPRVEPGGVLAGHDYGHPRFEGVKAVVDEFAKVQQLELKLAGSCWAVVKSGELAPVGFPFGPSGVAVAVAELDGEDME